MPLPFRFDRFRDTVRAGFPRVSNMKELEVFFDYV